MIDPTDYKYSCFDKTLDKIILFNELQYWRAYQQWIQDVNPWCTVTFSSPGIWSEWFTLFTKLHPSWTSNFIHNADDCFKSIEQGEEIISIHREILCVAHIGDIEYVDGISRWLTAWTNSGRKTRIKQIIFVSVRR